MPVSKQINTQRLPAYMKRRIDIPGPNTGFICAITGYKATGAGTEIIAIRIPGGFRPLAFGWYARAQTGTTNQIGIKGPSADDGSVGTNLNSGTNLDLDANPALVIFRGDPLLSIPTANVGNIIVSSSTDPEISTPFVAVRIVTTSVTDFNYVIWGMITNHIHADKAND